MRTCAWEGCDADEYANRLCETHLYPWPFERYIHGAEPTGRRVRRDGYAELEIDGLWALEHRLMLSKELGRHLRHDEVIVHLDGDRANNDRANLMLTDKSGAMKYRKEHPRWKTISTRHFIGVIEFDIHTDQDFAADEVMDAIASAFNDGEFVGYVSDGGTFKITKATIKRARPYMS